MVDLADRLYDFTPDVSDGLIALRLADYLLADAKDRRGYYRLRILAARGEPTRLPCSRRRKNAVEFITKDREAAAGWIVQAALAGHAVSRAVGPDGWAGGMGTIADIRADAAGEHGKRARACLREAELIAEFS